MKIMFRVTNLTTGGAEKVVLSLASNFSNDNDVIIVVDNTDGENYILAKELGLKVHCLNVKRTISSILPFSKYIKAEKPDLIYSALTDPNAAAILSNIIAGSVTKVVVSEHAPVVRHWKNKSTYKKIQLWAYVLVVYRFAASVVCVSEGVSNELRKYTFLKNIQTIYNPIREFSQPFKSKINTKVDFFKILTVGRITKAKNLECLVNAAASLRDKKIVFRWSIVGAIDDEVYYCEIKQLIKKLCLDEQINFFPFTNKLEEYYQQADLFVLTSAWEGFGNVLVEALQFGIPIVSTDCDYGPREILDNGNYGILVPVGDYNQLSEAIENCISGKKNFSTDMQIERSKMFSEKNIVERYRVFFEKLYKRL